MTETVRFMDGYGDGNRDSTRRVEEVLQQALGMPAIVCAYSASGRTLSVHVAGNEFDQRTWRLVGEVPWVPGQDLEIDAIVASVRAELKPPGEPAALPEEPPGA